MHHAKSEAILLGQPIEVEQARNVGGSNHAGSGILVVDEPIEPHPAGNRLFFDGKEASKTAAFVTSDEINQFEVGDGRQQGSRGIQSLGLLKFARGSVP